MYSAFHPSTGVVPLPSEILGDIRRKTTVMGLVLLFGGAALILITLLLSLRLSASLFICIVPSIGVTALAIVLLSFRRSAVADGMLMARLKPLRAALRVAWLLVLISAIVLAGLLVPLSLVSDTGTRLSLVIGLFVLLVNLSLAINGYLAGLSVLKQSLADR